MSISVQISLHHTITIAFHIQMLSKDILL